MYIEPNTNIVLYNIPLNKNSDDTFWFANRQAQLSYFANHRIASFPKCTYQRATKGMCRVEGSISSLYNANYMSFQNNSFGGKVFYAWIDNIEYVNNITTEIYFTVDVIQSWFFEMELGECFIERQHSETDGIGDNILPERVATGEYVYNGSFQDLSPTLRTYKIAVAYLPDDNAYTYYQNIFGACAIRIYDTTQTDMEALKTFVDSFVPNVDDVIAIYMLPAFLVPNLSGGALIPTQQHPSTQMQIDVSAISTSDTLDGYTPKNRKLYTYPYNFYNLFALNSNLALRYEFFQDLTPRFRITGTYAEPVEINCIPIAYKNVGIYQDLDRPENMSERLTLRGFPVCSWSTDYYRAWLAQNSVPMFLSGTKTAIDSIVGMMIGAGGGTGASIIGQGENILDKAIRDLSAVYQASIQSDITKGNFQSANDDFSNLRMTFKGGRMSVPHEYAESIDNFFTMFGYTQNKVGIPNIHARSRYTYIKTADAQIQGNMPVDWADEIAQMFNTGLRFWSDTADNRIGKYPVSGSNTLDNNTL